MKKAILFSLSILLSILSHGQAERGTMLINGALSVSGSSLKSGGDKIYTTSNVSLYPKLGWFTSENTVVGFGLTLSYNYSLQSTYYDEAYVYDKQNRRKTYTTGLDFFIRKYIHLTEKFYFSLESTARFSYSGVNTKTSSLSDTMPDIINYGGERIRSFGVVVTPGFTYFVNPKFAIDVNYGQLYYNYSKSTNRPNSVVNYRQHSYGFNLKSNTISIGVSFFI